MIFFVLLLFLTIAVSAFGYSKLKKYVMENSVALKKIDSLSNRYFFYSIESSHTYTKKQKNLAAFRRINYNDELVCYVKSHQMFFEDQIKKATENDKQYKQYCSEFDYIHKTYKNTWNSKLKDHIEEKLIQNSKLSPVCSIDIEVENVYISPKGRNRYYDSCVFTQWDIIRVFSKIQNQKTFEAKKHEERAKMSDSLRYDILKRDGFRCVICGASAQDGAKLHVDHIIPVAKGGKTIRSNLRTLCSSCNLGKRDKYDPKGIN